MAVFFIAGCATQAPHFRLDSSLKKEMMTFNGAEYLPAVKFCNTYNLDYKWDHIVNSATIRTKYDNIVLRAGSNVMLLNGSEKKLDRPVILAEGTVYVPVSFAKNIAGPIIGKAPAEKIEEPERPKRVRIKTIVLDPGHGGNDVGAIGRRLGLKESEMALSLSRKIKNILEGNGINVIMTRDSDNFIPLSRRSEIANRASADLFVSVHINASRSRSMRGFECYFLSNNADDNARASQARDSGRLKTTEGAEVEHSYRLDKTLWDMKLSEDRRQSAELSSYICDSIKNNFTMGNRGIRSARFYVLKYTRIPAILVEAGYISNRYEEMKLKDPKFLDRVADAIAEGILKFKREYERTEGFST